MLDRRERAVKCIALVQGADTFKSNAVTNSIHVKSQTEVWWDLEEMLSKIDNYVAHMVQIKDTLKLNVQW